MSLYGPYTPIILSGNSKLLEGVCYMKKRYLEFVDLESGETVHQVEIKPDKSERSVERIMSGMLINMGDGLFIRDTKDNEHGKTDQDVGELSQDRFWQTPFKQPRGTPKDWGFDFPLPVVEGK
jgi:hypothetical protein